MMRELATGKRLRRAKPICSCCVSPRRSSSFNSFDCYEEDVWTEISKYLDGKSLVMLGTTNKWFKRHIMEEDSIWKFACLRDLQVPHPPRVSFNWIKLYASAFDGSHSYSFHQREKHIDWMRIGAFFFDSSRTFLTNKIHVPMEFPRGSTAQMMLQSCGCCVLNNVKTGIWIADLQLARCPVCDQNSCDGTMQALDTRHIELFLCDGFKNGSWEYELIGSHDIPKHADGASGAIFDLKHLKDRSSIDVFNTKSWVGKQCDWQPKAKLSPYAVAINTNLAENDGLNVKYHVMTSGPDGEIVAIKISQQLL